jgi:hypothetical protein
MLKAIVVYPNEKTKDMGNILQIARSVAKKVEKTSFNLQVLSIIFDPVTRVHVAIYESCSSSPDAGEGKQDET